MNEGTKTFLDNFDTIQPLSESRSSIRCPPSASELCLKLINFLLQLGDEFLALGYGRCQGTSLFLPAEHSLLFLLDSTLLGLDLLAQSTLGCFRFNLAH